jgi:hypothetical protein
MCVKTNEAKYTVIPLKYRSKPFLTLSTFAITILGMYRRNINVHVKNGASEEPVKFIKRNWYDIYSDANCTSMAMKTPYSPLATMSLRRRRSSDEPSL